MKKLTEKEFKVLEFLINKGRNYNTSVHGTLLTKIIFDEETIKKYSPVIITERSHGFDVIEGLGYSPVEILQMDTVFIREFY